MGDGNKVCSQKMGLGRVASKLHVGGWRVRNAHRCQVNQVCVKPQDAGKKGSDKNVSKKGGIIGAGDLWLKR